VGELTNGWVNQTAGDLTNGWVNHTSGDMTTAGSNTQWLI